MDYVATITDHYRHGNLLSAIRAGLEKQGITPEAASVDDLGPIDEFHIGGRAASIHFLDKMELTTSQTILDVGCGLGGSARFAAKTYGAHIHGIDLTPEYVETGQVLCDWVGLSDRISLRQGSALALPCEDESLDGAYMMHVGMNIEDKPALFSEIFRVLKPGSKFGIYDIMSTGQTPPVYPVPWATTSDASWLAAPEQYREALEGTGFEVIGEDNRRDFAIAFFKKMKAASVDGPPPLGLHVLMQSSASVKIPNMVENLVQNRISPVEIIAVKQT